MKKYKNLSSVLKTATVIELKKRQGGQYHVCLEKVDGTQEWVSHYERPDLEPDFVEGDQVYASYSYHIDEFDCTVLMLDPIQRLVKCD